MANNSRCRCRPVIVTTAPSSAAVSSEPSVRRWAHPVNPRGTVEHQGDPNLRAIRCALACQTQLLMEIKTLLEQLVDTQCKEDRGSTT